MKILDTRLLNCTNRIKHFLICATAMGGIVMTSPALAFWSFNLRGADSLVRLDTWFRGLIFGKLGLTIVLVGLFAAVLTCVAKRSIMPMVWVVFLAFLIGITGHAISLSL